MRDRSNRISRLLTDLESRASYIKAKLTVLVPAQIRSLRLKAKNPEMPKQADLAREANMHQSRISMFETPGMANMTLETIARIAAALRVGVIIKFVPFHEMLRWENSFSPDDFSVTTLEEDEAFLAGDVQAQARTLSPMHNVAASGSFSDQLAAAPKKRAIRVDADAMEVLSAAGR